MFHIAPQITLSYHTLEVQAGDRKPWGETTMNHLLNVLDGFASVLGFWAPQQRLYRSGRGGFERDQAALRSDAKQVAKTLKKNINKHGKVGKSSSHR